MKTRAKTIIGYIVLVALLCGLSFLLYSVVEPNNAEAQTTPSSGGMSVVGSTRLNTNLVVYEVRDSNPATTCYVVQSNYGAAIDCR